MQEAEIKKGENEIRRILPMNAVVKILSMKQNKIKRRKQQQKRRKKRFPQIEDKFNDYYHLTFDAF